jgi:hypothetical protein
MVPGWDDYSKMTQAPLRHVSLGLRGNQYVRDAFLAGTPAMRSAAPALDTIHSFTLLPSAAPTSMAMDLAHGAYTDADLQL